MAGAAMTMSSCDMESKLRRLHNHLSLVLSEDITEVQFIKLRHHFRLMPFGDGILEKIKDFLQLWTKLETTGIIRVQWYDKLEDAFKLIQASSHNDVIQEFTEKMYCEAGSEVHTERQIHNKTITKEKLLKRIKLVRPLMEEDGSDFETVHVYNNAVFGLISRKDGGMLGLENGTAKLQIEHNTITNDQEVFWIFRPPADAEEIKRSDLARCRPIGQSLLVLHPADEHDRSHLAIDVPIWENNNDHVVKYSLPVNLGPEGVSFKQKVILTLKVYNFPYSTTGSIPLAVYKRTGDNGTWDVVGSCFFDRKSRSANVPLSKFSSYVLGMPATSELLPLNVHIMVQRLSKKEDDTTQPCDIQVVFSMNDHTYIQEMVLRKQMKIVCETSYYLDPKSDVMIRWEKRNADGSVRLKQTAVLEKGRLNRLAEKMQSVTIPSQNEIYLDEDHKDFVILEQNDTNLVELFCRDDRPMKKEERTPESPRRWAVGMAEMAVLQKGSVNRLAEEMQSLTTTIQDEQQLVEDGDNIVLMEQNDTNLVELFCRDDRPMNKEETTPKWPRRRSEGMAEKSNGLPEQKPLPPPIQLPPLGGIPTISISGSPLIPNSPLIPSSPLLSPRRAFLKRKIDDDMEKSEMASNNKLSAHLECSVCSDILTQPKYVGPCNHTCCKKCIEQYWVSCGKTTTIPCPQCRQECPIPQNGADGLKDNFLMSSIVETYQRAKRTVEVRTSCSACPEKARKACVTCDINMCPECNKKHTLNRRTANHDIYGLCNKHGKPFKFYCRTCKQVICSVCELSDHSTECHDVRPHRQVLDETLLTIKTCLTEVDSAVLQIEREEKDLTEIGVNIELRSERAVVEATAETKRNITSKKTSIRSLRGQSQQLEEQIQELVKKKNDNDQRVSQEEKDLDLLEKKTTKLAIDARETFTRAATSTAKHLSLLHSRKMAMKSKLENGMAATKEKIILDADSVAHFSSISLELVDLIRVSKDNGSKTVMQEVKKSIGEMTPHIKTSVN